MCVGGVQQVLTIAEVVEAVEGRVLADYLQEGSGWPEAPVVVLAYPVGLLHGP
jgi:hypothetical protein